jgi:hypothetical protein
MSRLLLGTICGLAFGAIVVALMLPMPFPDKRAALTGAFLNRFGIGVVLGAMIGSPQLAALGVSGWIIGAAVGLLLSLPDAIITKAYAPILIIGTVGSAVIGWIVTRWGMP